MTIDEQDKSSPADKKLETMINQSFCLGLVKQGDQYYGRIFRRHDTPSECERWLPFVSFDKNLFETPQEAATFLNCQKNNLIFSDNYANLNEIPTNALRFLKPIVLEPSLEQKGDTRGLSLYTAGCNQKK